MALSRSAGDATLLFIVGGDVRVGDKIRYYDCSDLSKLLLKREPYHRLHVTPNYLRQKRRADLSQYRSLVSLLAEPEKNERVLENLRKLLRGAPGKVVNGPDAVLRSARDKVAKLLSGIAGLRVPATVRLPAGKAHMAAEIVARAGLDGRVILREAGRHGGKIVGLFDSPADAAGATTRSGEHIATQFVDFASSDGLYRKYRLFFIGQQMILRHKLISDHWNVHAKDRPRFMAERPELIAEERALFADPTDALEPTVRQVLLAIRERMPLDFFGVDFGVAPDGQVVLFEANAAMCFFPFSPDPRFAYLQRCFAPAQRAFRDLLGLPAEQPSAPAARVRLAS